MEHETSLLDLPCCLVACSIGLSIKHIHSMPVPYQTAREMELLKFSFSVM